MRLSPASRTASRRGETRLLALPPVRASSNSASQISGPPPGRQPRRRSAGFAASRPLGRTRGVARSLLGWLGLPQVAGERAATVDDRHRSPVLDQVKRRQQLPIRLEGNGEPEPQSEPPDPTWHIDGQPDQLTNLHARIPLSQIEGTHEGLDLPSWCRKSRSRLESAKGEGREATQEAARTRSTSLETPVPATVRGGPPPWPVAGPAGDNLGSSPSEPVPPRMEARLLDGGRSFAREAWLSG